MARGFSHQISSDPHKLTIKVISNCLLNKCIFETSFLAIPDSLRLLLLRNYCMKILALTLTMVFAGLTSFPFYHFREELNALISIHLKRWPWSNRNLTEMEGKTERKIMPKRQLKITLKPTIVHKNCREYNLL